MKPVVTFGEIMARLATPGFLRLRQTQELEVTYAGAEASVAASICVFGGAARYVTALPRHAMADAALDRVRALGVDTRFALRTEGGRLGLYFLETGANQRPSTVLYDRADSAIARTPATAYDWAGVLEGARWLHLSGITPALSQQAAEATRRAAEVAAGLGVPVSLDLNFRQKLWRWDPSRGPRELAEATMRGILPFVDTVIANEEDCSAVLGIHAENTDVQAGRLDVARYAGVAGRVVEQFPGVARVAITLRESLSATHNNWGALLHDRASGLTRFAPTDAQGNYAPYPIHAIVDRVGGGDAFAAGLIFSLITPGLSEPQTALDFAVAASCLKHSIKGDFNFSSRPEVEALMKGSTSGRVIR